MADLSFVFNPSDMQTELDTASAKAVAGSSNAASVAGTIATKSAVWDLASGASSRIAESSAKWDAGATAASKASDASSAIGARSAKWDKGSAASTKTVSMASTMIRSIPAANSRAVHEIVYTSKSSIKFVYSSLAA